MFVTVGGKKGVGQFLLAGNDEDVAALGPKSAVDVNIALHNLTNCIFSNHRVAEFLGGKGGGRKGHYQGKASRMENSKQAEDYVRDTLAIKKEMA